MDTELRVSSGQTIITVNYPQNPAPRAPAAVQVSGVQPTLPTVSSAEYAAKKAAIAAYSQPSFSAPPALEIMGTAQRTPGGGPAARAPITGTPTINWEGIQIPAGNQISLPSPDLAVGPSDAIMVVNSTIAAFTKAGALKSQVDFNTWFAPLLPTLCPTGGCLIFDPWIRYDQMHGRYLFLAASRSGNFQTSYLLVSISNGASFDSGWKIWALNGGLEGITPTGLWADSWRLGFDNAAVYLSGNMFDTLGRFQGSKIRLLLKTELYNPATSTLHWTDIANLNNGTPDGSKADSLVPAHQRGKPAAVNSSMLVNSTTFSVPANYLTVWKIEDPLALPLRVTRCTIHGVLPYTYPAPAPQLGSFATLDSGDSRTLKAIYRNGFLYTARDSGYTDQATTVAFDLIDTKTMLLASQGRLRNSNAFYPGFDVPASTPSGTLFPTDNVVTGTTTAADGSLTYPSLLRLKAGESPYLIGPSPEPWGDYSGGTVDPVTGGLWTSGEYGKTTSSWGTWVGYFPWTPTGSFTDVQPGNFFADYINVLATWQVTLGCTATQYCPTDPVSRGQLAAFIIRSLYGDNFTFTATPYFTDVPSTYPFFSYIQKLRDLGITQGCTPTTFCPGDPVTRGQAAVLIIRGKMASVFGDTFTYPQQQVFTDVPPASMQFPFVQKLFELGITSGCTPTLFCVNNTLTRQEMAVFIVRAFLN